METKSLPQPGSIHNYFNAFHRLIPPVVLSLTVIVSRSRIYANIGHGFSINFNVDLIDTIPQIFVVFRGDIVIFPKAIFKSDYPNIGTNPKRLVVYFSRMGYVKSRRWKKRIGQVPLSMKFAPRSAQKEHWASGGADAMGCTAGDKSYSASQHSVQGGRFPQGLIIRQIPCAAYAPSDADAPENFSP